MIPDTTSTVPMHVYTSGCAGNYVVNGRCATCGETASYDSYISYAPPVVTPEPPPRPRLWLKERVAYVAVVRTPKEHWRGRWRLTQQRPRDGLRR